MEIHHGNISIATLGVNLQQIWTFSPGLQAIPIRTTDAATIGGRNLELVQVCLSKVGWPAWCCGHLADYPLAGSRECTKGCPGVEGGVLRFCLTLGARIPGTSDYMLRTLRALV